MLGTGDSDFTPLVHKLRELNRRVIGIGIEASTSALLPPACDEFLFYERLEGVEPIAPKRASRRAGPPEAAPAEPDGRGGDDRRRRRSRGTGPAPTKPTSASSSRRRCPGLERSTGGPVLASMLKRTILRKDPTFSETTYGFRGFVELLRHLAERGVVELGEGTNTGDPDGRVPDGRPTTDAAFELLRSVVDKLAAKAAPPHLSGLKNQLRKAQPDFSEKRFGYGGFLQFAKAAAQRGVVELEYDDDADDYIVRPGTDAPTTIDR